MFRVRSSRKNARISSARSAGCSIAGEAAAALQLRSTLKIEPALHPSAWRKQDFLWEVCDPARWMHEIANPEL